MNKVEREINGLGQFHVFHGLFEHLRCRGEEANLAETNGLLRGIERV